MKDSKPWLEITTKIGCKLNCNFCPQSTLVKKYDNFERLMSLENFKKIISTIPKDVQIHFSGYSEPFLNPMASAMMVETKKNRYKISLFTTLIGFNENDAELIKKIDFAYIKIHLPDTIGMKINEDEWIEKHNIFLKYNFNRTKYMSMGILSEKIKQHLLKYVDPEAYKKSNMISRSGLIKVENQKPVYKTGPIECKLNKWHQNVVLPDGSVYLCCNDYGLTAKLGNLLQEDYIKIYEKAEEYKEKYKFEENTICRSCEWAGPVT